MDDAHDEDSKPGPFPNPPTPPVFEPAPRSDADVSLQPLTYWLRKFFVCNPFYLASAALLLYGVYLVSSDTGLFHAEIAQLGFNFGSLQLYEALLVITAIVLSRRRIWYDSLLLVGLENLLVLAPFILISQASLLDQPVVWVICLVAGAAAIVRFAGLKRFFAELNLPRRALVCGLVLLAVNVALPLIFRHLHDSKVGTKPTDGAAYDLNRYSWLLLLPAMFALINLLPRPQSSGELLPQRRWLPISLFGLWLTASAVHLFSLSYVYNFDWEPAFKAPLIWVALWSVYFRRRDFVERPIAALERILLVPPALVPLLALNGGDKTIFLALTILNIFGYAFLLVKDFRNRTALVLLFATGEGLAMRFSSPAAAHLPMLLRADELIILTTAAFLLFWVIRSRSPKVSLLGSFILGVAGALLSRLPDLSHLMFHLAFAFVALHSLRWTERGLDVEIFRFMNCAVWFGDALFMLHSEWAHALPIVYTTGAITLAMCVGLRFFTGSWNSVAVPITAAVILLAQPGEFVVTKAFALPAGLLAVGGSFCLFALGTLAALTKSRWNRPGVPVLPAINKHDALIL